MAFPALLWGEDLRHTVEYVRPYDSESWKRAVLAEEVEWAFVVIGSREDKFLADSSRFALTVDDRRIEAPATLRTRVYRVVSERSGK